MPMDQVNSDISIIIPVLDEKQRINTTVRDISSHRVAFQGTFEIIVVDGDPAGQTCAAVADPDVTKLLSEAGRGGQMNKGASIAQGKVLLFLHADTRLEPGFLSQICLMIEEQQYSAGTFDLRIDAPGVVFRIVERVSSIRSRLTRTPYGDQGIFIRRDVFTRIGGYPEIPLMEDVALMRLLRKDRYKIGFPNAKAITSARRWQQEGWIYTSLRNWALVTLYTMGVSPVRLARFYRNVR